MRRHVAKWRIKDWSDVFEFGLTVGSIYSGLIYLLGPDRLRSIYVYVNQFTDGTLGMQFLGGMWLAAGLLQLASKVLHPRPTNLRRIGHAVAAGAYFLMGLGLLLPVIIEALRGVGIDVPLLRGTVGAGAAFVPYFMVTLLHIYFGTEQPRLTRRPGAAPPGKG